jgi:hypothetical protein
VAKAAEHQAKPQATPCAVAPVQQRLACTDEASRRRTRGDRAPCWDPRVAAYELEFYEDEHGDKPVLRWIREELSPTQRLALGQAMRAELQEKGLGVCGTKFGKQLGKGLFEFRVRRSAPNERILLRVFCHAYGNKLILLLGGYDKGADASPRRQSDEIAVARARLAEWRRRHVAP